MMMGFQAFVEHCSGGLTVHATIWELKVSGLFLILWCSGAHLRFLFGKSGDALLVLPVPCIVTDDVQRQSPSDD